MKFQIGWIQSEEFQAHHIIKELSKRKDKIESIYFAPLSPSIPSARYRPFSKKAESKLFQDLEVFSEEGFKLNILLNGLCYGGEIHYSKTFHIIFKIIDYYRKRFNVTDATFIDPVHAITCRKNFPSIKRHASINMFIRDLAAYKEAAKIFDVINIDRRVNYNISLLKKCKADNPHTELKVIANEACIYSCTQRALHFAHLSHSPASFRLRCYFNYKDNCFGELLASPLILPQYLKYYEGIVDIIKLCRGAGTPTGSYLKRIDAYLEGDSDYSLIGLGVSNGLFRYCQELGKDSPYLKVTSKDISHEHFQKKSTCLQNCYECNYCYNLGNSLEEKMTN